ncbi:DUF1076 domain-containing protein [Escherichia coli]|uniref:DUF1076 domain-containing protein n=1 Tax=Escherichia coli TaxID=562 RepID=UPI0018E48BF2|nr:DUF1076 domain-containing protein [Escherichia coli]
MPFSFNLSSGNYLSTQDVEVLQRATRDHQMERLTIGERSFSVRYQSAMDAFIVDPVQGELYSGLIHTELADIIRLADSVENQLNGGNSFLDVFSTYMGQVISEFMHSNDNRIELLQQRLHSCSFLVNIEEMSYIDEALQCPITLAIPQRGVFLRNAEGSRVCSLYDEMALSRIINDGMHHPLSREPITLSMLVAREQCEFDCSIGHFTVRSDCYSE